jgi:hypothetical protein
MLQLTTARAIVDILTVAPSALAVAECQAVSPLYAIHSFLPIRFFVDSSFVHLYDTPILYSHVRPAVGERDAPDEVWFHPSVW